jgi:uncharacterized phosphatase
MGALMPAHTIYVVRHGATAMNNQTDVSEDRIRGWRDVPLAPKGRQEALQAADDLRPFAITRVYTSDLSRARETAEIICNTLSISHCEINSKLRPWNLGTLTGQVTKHALPIIKKFVCDTPQISVPDGESFDTFKQRALRGLSEITLASRGLATAIITHHRNERLFISLHQPIDTTNYSQPLHISTFLSKGEPPGAIMPLEVQEPHHESNQRTRTVPLSNLRSSKT